MLRAGLQVCSSKARERHEYCSAVAAQSRVTAVRLAAHSWQHPAASRSPLLFGCHICASRNGEDPIFAGSVLPESAFYSFAEKSDRLHTTPEVQAVLSCCAFSGGISWHGLLETP
eukprot:Skav229244  [mRNA]  locus=scaffold2154:191519:192212:+ [translate_table: standard]